ncbi:momilactone-A synthase [Ranunculus cassubicifolius]
MMTPTLSHFSYTTTLNSLVAARLEGKVALITGGASGIGASTAKLYTKLGAKVVIADLQDDLGDSLCLENANMDYIHCDVTNEEDVKAAVNMTVAKYGQLDILYSNAGITGNWGFDILTTGNENFKKVLNVNVFGAFLCAKYAAGVMIPAKKGSIIFTSSVVSVISCDGPHAYTVSKHALVGLMKNLCAELGQYGIRVNCISPYAIATPMVTAGALGLDESVAEEISHNAANLKGVVIKAEDVAEAAVYLGSDESRYISGLNLVVDGGYSVTTPATKFAMKNLLGEQ